MSVSSALKGGGDRNDRVNDDCAAGTTLWALGAAQGVPETEAGMGDMRWCYSGLAESGKYEKGWTGAFGRHVHLDRS